MSLDQPTPHHASIAKAESTPMQVEAPSVHLVLQAHTPIQLGPTIHLHTARIVQLGSTQWMLLRMTSAGARTAQLENT